MWKKISSVVVVALVLVGYNHCGMPTSSNQKSSLEFSHPDAIVPTSTNSVQDVSSEEVDDLEIFSSTLWQITKNRCASCHGSIQQPLHGSSNATTAYNAVIDGHKVNFSNPATSRMVLKLKDENHNCWSNCADNSNEILAQVTKWVNSRSVSASTEDVGSSSLTTSESKTLEESIGTDGDLGIIKLDPLAAMIQAPFTRGASGDVSYIHAPGTGVLRRVNDGGAGMAYFNFSSMKTAQYKMWAYVDAKTGSDDSFFIKVNNDDYTEWHIGQTNGFEWKMVTQSSGMNAKNFFIAQSDSNRLEVRQREDGAKLSNIILTDNLDDQAFESFDLGASVTYRFDISSMLNLGAGSASLEIDCREFDEYTYQFSNPRIVSTSRIKVKGMKLLINGNYNPQHATYSFVDTVTTPGTSSLSEYSLVAIKENGVAADRFSFSFDVLELD